MTRPSGAATPSDTATRCTSAISLSSCGARAAGASSAASGPPGLQVDHKTPLSVRIDHSLANLWALCSGPGSCKAVKSSRAGGQARRATPRDAGFTTPNTPW